MSVADDDIMGLLTEAISQMFGIDPADVTKETTASDIDGWDSVSNSLLLLRLEEVMGRELPVSTLLEARNVGELGDTIRGALRGTGETEQTLDPGFLEHFEPLGDNCELGFVLAHFGSTDSSIFRWMWVPAASLCRILDAEFDRFFDFGVLRPHADVMLFNQRYDVAFHTAMHSSNGQYVFDEAKLRSLYRIEKVRIEADIEKFSERLRHGNKICLLKTPAISDQDVVQVQAAIDRFSGHQTNQLLVVCESQDAVTEPAGSVKPWNRRICRGYLSHVSPPDGAHLAQYSEWQSILPAALQSARR